MNGAFQACLSARSVPLLSISRSSFYYEPKGESELNLALMCLIDRQFLETPFYGVCQMTWHLRNEGHLMNEKRIRRLMRLMGLMPIYQKPNTSKAARGHKIYPYLLRRLQVTQPNQVWCSDITYLPMQRGFLYLIAIMDWHTRKVLSWRISNTLEAGFCVDALNEAIYKFGPPEIINALIQRLAANHQPWFIGGETKQPTLTSTAGAKNSLIYAETCPTIGE